MAHWQSAARRGSLLTRDRIVIAAQTLHHRPRLRVGCRFIHFPQGPAARSKFVRFFAILGFLPDRIVDFVFGLIQQFPKPTAAASVS